MSAFSRGCLFRRQSPFTMRTIHFFLPSNRVPNTRFLSSSSILRAVTKTANTAKKTAPSITLKQALPKGKPSFAPTPSQPPTYQSYAQILALKPHPTLLYQAPSHTAFILSSYVTAGFCFTYAVVAFWSNYLKAPETITYWVPIAFGVICFGMAGAGTFFLLGPAWIVKSITAMPPAALKAAGAVPSAAKSVGNGVVKGNGAPALHIEVELRKMLPLPFFPARKIYVRPDEVQLPHQLARPTSSLSPAQRAALKAQEEAEREAELEYERTHIMSRPIRHMSRAFFELFQGARRIWTREGFTAIYVKGYKYKLDVSGGWALDGGKAIDRLVTIKPKL